MRVEIIDDTKKRVVVAQGNSCYDSRSGCNAIIETSTNKLILGCKTTDIPFSVTSIGNGAFCHCRRKDLLIPDEVTEIASDAFSQFRGRIYFP